MKKLVVIMLGVLIILLGLLCIKINKSYNEIYKNFYDNIGEYEKTVSEYKKEKDDAFLKINNLATKKIDKVSDVKKVYDELDNSAKALKLDGDSLKEKIDALNEQKKVLTGQYNKLVEEERKKHTYMIRNVKTINQYSIGYPTGCESTALTILLNYYGVNVSVKDVVSLLRKGDLPHSENGVRYGGNPFLEFIGHPADPYSYGVYDEPIVLVAEQFKPGIINGRGMSLNQVLELVRQDKPVVVWNTMNLAVPYINQSWIYKPTGETIKWLTSLHALVVIGYNDSQVIVSDSLNGKVRYFDKKTFESRYNAFGKRALYY